MHKVYFGKKNHAKFCACTFLIPDECTYVRQYLTYPEIQKYQNLDDFWPLGNFCKIQNFTPLRNHIHAQNEKSECTFP